MKFLKALSIFAGTIIGVGIFGLPYVASKTGFWMVFFYFLLMSAIVIIIHLIYGKIALGTEGLYRLPGYVGEYLGANWKKAAFFIFAFGLMGALLAYLIVGGEFLALFFVPLFGGNALVYTLFFFGVGALLIFLGIKSIAKVELALLGVFFIILFIFFIKAFFKIDLGHFQAINWKFFTFPYGITLFALWGAALIPEIKEILGNDAKLLRKVIISGILLAALTYLFFVVIVFGVSGSQTSKEAISGLAFALGNGIIRLGFLFGVITCFTSFIALGLTLKKVFWYDFGISPNLAWLITAFLPLLLFLIGLREFLDIIGLTGAIAIGLEGFIVVFLYREFLKKKFNQKMNPLFYILPIFFVLGVFFEVYYFLTRL